MSKMGKNRSRTRQLYIDCTEILVLSVQDRDDALEVCCYCVSAFA